MPSIKNIDRFLSRDQWRKLRDQLDPVCEKHCNRSLECRNGVPEDCPVQVYIKHLRSHTRFYIENTKNEPNQDGADRRSIYREEIKKALSMPEYNRINTKFRKLSMIAGKLIEAGYSVKLDLSIQEVRNIMEELHEFDVMIRDIDNMILRGYFYSCLDDLTGKCRSFEEDLRWAIAERESENIFNGR